MGRKTDIAREAVEFLPDAREIQQERLPWYLKAGVLWLFALAAAALVWACIGKVDVIVRAQGKLVSDGGDIVMKVRESSVIKEINVHKGDIVEPGQILVTFDPSVNQAEVDRLTGEISVLDAERQRLMAESEEREYHGGSDSASQLQEKIFQERRRYFEERLRYFKVNSERIETALASTRASHEKYREILGKLSEIEQMYRSLQEVEAASTKEVLEVTMKRLEGEGEVDRLANEITGYLQQKMAADAEKSAFVEEWRNGISEKLVNCGRELDNARKQLEKAKSLVSYVNLKAPCRAVVHEMAAFPVGSAVGEAEAVITLVPLDGTLEVEARIRPRDIALVKAGDDVRVKLSAFPFQRHGTLDGKLRLVSANTFPWQMSSEEDEKGESTFYRGYVTLSGRLRNVPDDMSLVAGMEAEAEIKTGRRRIIEYIVHPLIKGFDEAFREP